MIAVVYCVLCGKMYDNLDGNELTRHCFCGGILMPRLLNKSTNLIYPNMVFEETSFIEYPTVSC